VHLLVVLLMFHFEATKLFLNVIIF